MNPYRKNRAIGFTLIEVLVALAILSIALTAIIKAASQNIRDTNYLQDKNIAVWAATETINEARAGILKLQTGPDKFEEEKKILGEALKIEAYSVSSPNPNIQELRVDVFRQADNTKLITLTSYRYVP